MQQLEPLRAAAGRRAAHAAGDDVSLQDFGIGHVVFDDEDASMGELAHVHQRRGRGRRLQRQAEPEGRTLGFGAVEADLAAHQLDQLTADRQTQACATVTAHGRTIGLGERVEKARMRLRRDADARIAHADVQPIGAQQRHLDHDFAFFGELQAVRQQIGQHLAEAQGVAVYRRWQALVDVAGELQFLGVRARRHQLHDVLYCMVQIETDRLDLELAGLDLREVENVVDDGEERFARAADGFQVTLLLRIERRFQQQFGEAQDAVHWRADFVAHVGQELRLGPARVFSHGLRLAQFAFAVTQRLFGQRAPGGVEKHRIDAHDLAVLVDVRYVLARVPHRVAVAIAAPPLQGH